MSKGTVVRFCGDVMSAEAFLDNDNTTEILGKQQKKLAEEGFLPSDMDAVCTFHVYWLQGDFAKHASIVFTSNNEHCVTAELQWFTPPPTFQHTCLPWANGFLLSQNQSRTSKMTKCGTVRRSARQVILAGIQAMRRFGSYGKYTNNCQNYCNLVLEVLGLSTQWTDTGKMLVISNVFAPLVYLGFKAREAWS